jgi:hypothetical protein
MKFTQILLAPVFLNIRCYAFNLNQQERVIGNQGGDFGGQGQTQAQDGNRQDRRQGAK